MKLHAAMAERGIQPPAVAAEPPEPRTQPFECEFGGLRFIIDPGVFEPSPLSLTSVNALLDETTGSPAPVVVDVGTGCGALAIAYALRRPDARVYALDVSPAAVVCARANAERLHAANVEVRRGSLLEPLTGLAVDGLLANIPWVAPAVAAVKELERPNRWRGPRETVQGSGSDGLDLQRELLRQAQTLMKPTGVMVLEIDDWQTDLLARELSADYIVRIDAARQFLILRHADAGSQPNR